MTTLVLAVVGLAVINFAFKAVGPALLGGRTLPPRVQSAISALPPALLTALLLADLLGEHWSSTAPTVLPGLVAALALRLRGWSHLACIAVAVATAILLRAVT